MKASKFQRRRSVRAEVGGRRRADRQVCRKAGISDATFYNWHKKYVGLMSSEMKRLRQLKGENAKLEADCR